MKFVSILPFLFLLPLAHGNCLAYVVNPPGVAWLAQECGMLDAKNVTQYDLKTGVCTGSQVCEVAGYPETIKCTSPIAPTPNNASYPGEPCDVLHLCFDGECKNGRCAGLNAADPCDNAMDCGGSLTCGSKNTCVPLAAVGESCMVDTDCVQNAGCDVGAGSGNCTLYLSIAPQQPVQSCGGQQQVKELVSSPFCESTLCYVPELGATPLCSDVISSAGSVPQRCSGPGDNSCVSTKDSKAGTTLSNPCQCGYDGFYYCVPFPGDAVSQAFYKDVAKWLLTEEWLICNTIRNTGALPSYTRDWCTESTTNPTQQMLFDAFQESAYQMVANAPADTLNFLWPQFYNNTPGPNPGPSPGDFSAWLGVGIGLVATILS